MTDVKTSDETAASALDGAELVRIVQGGANRKATVDEIAGRSGLVLLASGTISSPTGIIDVPMPADYAYFELTMVGMTLDGADDITFRFSSDGGLTYHSGASDYFMCSRVNAGSDASPPNDMSGFAFPDSEGWLLTETYQPDAGMIVKATIFPGTASTAAIALGTQGFGGVSDNANLAITTSALLAETARQDYFRFGPLFGDGANFTAGSYFWEGRRNP